ncbi:MAG: NYN domain-containing protein [Solobacterium sp.]|nr:NYN domain-containing protein [Solobacterium sp.]
MKRIVVGVLAHVDAGKTTLIESFLFHSGLIKQPGRVDLQNAFLDYNQEEKKRGITISSKEAHITWKDSDIELIDTPGHVDFSGDMERALQIIDMAVLILGAQDGIKAHTKTIWRCLEEYEIPTLVFINKMDLEQKGKEALLKDLSELSPYFVEGFEEETIAASDESLLDAYLQNGHLTNIQLQEAFEKRLYLPVFFGSALKQEGTKELLDILASFAKERDLEAPLGGKVFQITYDNQGQRLTHVKLTQGTLRVKEALFPQEKVDQIRWMNGNTFQTLERAEAGQVVALKGIHSLQAGDAFGSEETKLRLLNQPCITYALVVEEDIDRNKIQKVCEEIADEDPLLEMKYDTQSGEILFSLMGEIQKEVLQAKILEKTGITVSFEEKGVIYKETILNPILGVGHYEPLRHYAEVQLLLEPAKRGQGIVIENRILRERLSPVHQKSILHTLQNTLFKGVLIGAPLTDVKIILVDGKGHLKHTEGGDFREATIRAVRQGLMKAESILLEPYGQYEIEVEASRMSKVLFDLQQLGIESPHIEEKEVGMLIMGRGPMKDLLHYQKDFLIQEKGKGNFLLRYDKYDICMHEEEVLATSTYESEADLEQPCGSIFTKHGAGFYVPWHEVEDYVEVYEEEKNTSSYERITYHVSKDEVDTLVEKSVGNNRNPNKVYTPKEKEKIKMKPIVDDRPELYVIDGYNLLYEMEELKALAKEDLYAAREKLMDILFNYIGYTGQETILVFDGYKVSNHSETNYDHNKLKVVYTKTGETADAYIARQAEAWKKKYRIKVVSSDALVQNAIFSQGASRMSSREYLQLLEALKQIK